MSLPQLYPWLLTLGLIALFITLFRLDRKISRGPLDAGERHRKPVRPPGQDSVPWELRKLDAQLTAGRDRPELIQMINRLINEADLGGRHLELATNASNDQIGEVVSLLEQHLALKTYPGDS